MIIRMSAEISVLEASEISHNYYKAAVEGDPNYNGFNLVDFNPEWHSLDDIVRPYLNDPEGTQKYSGAGFLLAGGSERTGFLAVKDQLAAVYKRYRIPELLRDQSFINNFCHIHFADEVLLTLAHTHASVDLKIFPNLMVAASHAWDIVSRSIDVLALDITEGSIAENGLRHECNLVKTNPSSDKGKSIPGLPEGFRQQHAFKFKKIINEDVLGRPGNTVFNAAEGTQVHIDQDSEVYEMIVPKDESCALLFNRLVLQWMVKCVPVINDGQLAPDNDTIVGFVGRFLPKDKYDVYDIYCATGQVAANLLIGSTSYPNLEVVRFNGHEFRPED